MNEYENERFERSADVCPVSIQCPPFSEGTDMPSAIMLPTPLRGARKISTKSRFSARGYVVARLPDHPNLAKIGYESRLEQAFLLLCLAKPDVVDIIEQPFTIIYHDRHGRKRRHTFDYLVTLSSGRRLAVQVKRADRAVDKEVARELALVERSMPSSMADEVRLFTEQHIDWTAVENASQMVECRKHIDKDADDTLSEMIASLRGRTTIRELGCLAGLGRRSYPAIVRAIFAGSLRQISPGFIGAQTIIEKGAVQ